MNKSIGNIRLYMVIGNWDWQPQKLKEQYGQLLYNDLKFEVGKENDLLTRIGIRLNKTHQEVINILKRLRFN
ncbi:general stress protein CsbD [Saprospiraceae bacterium]|nr:general stress protein CsbD [Saprospiraceae bacterium]